MNRTTAAADYQQEKATATTWGKGVVLMGTRTITAGDYMDVEIYPLVAVEDGRWVQQKKRSREAQKKINLRNAQKRLARLLNANFGPGDLLGHFTCAMGCTEEQAKKEARNFMQRLRRRAAKRGMALKYIYVIETTGSGERLKFHIHAAINGGFISRDEMEAVWGKGLARVDRCKDQPGGLKGFAHYITMRKETQEKLLQRRWACSQNLKQPIIRTSYRKFTRRDMAKMAGDAQDFAAFEKRFPGWELQERPEIRYSEFLPGAYITASLKRKKS